ncbi:MAG: FAD-dependent oxidoreductase [Lachnospiraceae bacterium]|nr:FAD-dependent oxidoreductase [Lachnospiraceae bacterium]
MYRINQIKLNINHDEKKLLEKVAKIAGVKASDIKLDTFTILRKSIDARDKNNILFVYNVAFELVDGKECGGLTKYRPIIFDPIVRGSHNSPVRGGSLRPVVVGCGPAGLFASYIFALNGLKPIVVERGKALEDRTRDVEKFFKTMELDENSNACFGEGGAGAFSDGKLNTNNKDHDGVYRFILETFVKFGADERILYESMPHIGTDKLVDVIKNMRNEIVRLGGEIHYNTRLIFESGLAVFAPTDGSADGIAVKDAPIVLAIGNSSRDTFRELYENGFDLKAKPIAVGYRIAHKQSFIDELQYGGSQSSHVRENLQSSPVRDMLGPATYKLTYDVGNGHAVYSFCMCPGGYIINSSNFKGYLSINGMSYNDRSGLYANSAIVETINPEDIRGSHSSPLLMMEFQEMVEKKAYELEKGYIPYIIGDGKDINQDEIFKGQARYTKELMSVYEECGLKVDINRDIEMALNHFNNKMQGFYDVLQYVIAGVETRTSSPVKLDRDENYMCNVKNFYPCGEGLGHGGGIMSSAADGVRVAMKVM